MSSNLAVPSSALPGASTSTSSADSPSTGPVVPTVSPSARLKLEAAILNEAEQAALTRQLQTLVDSFPALAHHSIHHTLPLGIATLTGLYAQYSVLPPPPSRPVISPLASCPPPPDLLSLITVLKAEINGLLAAIDPIRTWIALNIPRMQDQKGITVTTKEDVVDMLSQARQSCQAVLDGLTRYYSTRGKLVTKAVKFGLVEDYVVAVGELDRKQWRVAVTMLLDLRGNYAVLYDSITKNEDKLKHISDLNSYEHMY